MVDDLAVFLYELGPAVSGIDQHYKNDGYDTKCNVNLTFEG